MIISANIADVHRGIIKLLEGICFYEGEIEPTRKKADCNNICDSYSAYFGTYLYTALPQGDKSNNHEASSL